jgi:hypothetical protein
MPALLNAFCERSSNKHFQHTWVVGHTPTVRFFDPLGSQNLNVLESHTHTHFRWKCGTTFLYAMVFGNFSTRGTTPAAERSEQPAPAVCDRYTPALDHPSIETTPSKKEASQFDVLVSIRKHWGVEGKHDEPNMPSVDAFQMPDNASSCASSSPQWVLDNEDDESTIKSLLSEYDESLGNLEDQLARSEEIDNQDNLEDQLGHSEERDNQDDFIETRKISVTRKISETRENRSILSSNLTKSLTKSGPNSWEIIVVYLLSAKVWSCHDVSSI